MGMMLKTEFYAAEVDFWAITRLDGGAMHPA